MPREEFAVAIEPTLLRLATNDVEFGSNVIDIITDFLQQYGQLPTRETVLAGVGVALDRVFAGINTPGPDMIVEPALKSAILILVGYAYDAIAKQ